MLDVLLASRRPNSRPPVLGAATSSFVHLGLAALILIGSGTPVKAVSAKVSQLLEFLVPPNRSAATAPEQLRYLGTAAGTEDAPGTGTRDTRKTPGADALLQSGRVGATSTSDGLAAAPAAEAPVENAFSVLDVDTAAVRDPSSAAPEYPAAPSIAGCRH